MNLAKTQKAVLLKLAGKATHNLSCNHVDRAESFLHANGLAERYSFEGLVCGKMQTCYGTRISEAGKKLADSLP